jgi:hypothetical protein
MAESYRVSSISRSLCLSIILSPRAQFAGRALAKRNGAGGNETVEVGKVIVSWAVWPLS